MSKSVRSSRRFLAPLVTLGVAGALVIGSGADFTSASNNAASVVASGSLTQSNSRDGQAVFNVSNIKPGDVVKGSVVLTNTGSMPEKFSVAEVASSSFTTGVLSMVVSETKGAATTEVYNGVFGGFAAAARDLGVFAVGEARTYTFTVTLAQGADNANQNKTASASYVWTGSQTTAVTIDQTTAVNPVPATNANP